MDEDEPLLTKEEVKDRIHHWHKKAAWKRFDADIHIVDPLAHYAYLEYLKRDVVLHSEYFRCGGEYDLEDNLYDYNSALLERYPTEMIPDATWIRTDKTFKTHSSHSRFIHRDLAVDDGAASLQKSYTILCSIIAMLEHLKRWHFSTNFYSILTKDPQTDVAKLSPISQKRLEELKESIESSVQHIDAVGEMVGILEQLVAPRLSGLQEDMQLTMATGGPTDLATILTLLRMTVLVLDLALVSYVGSHGTSFLMADTEVIRIRSKHDNLRSVVMTRQSLACLNDFLDQTKVWLFDVEGNETATLQPGTGTVSNGLLILTRIDTFADIWGPVWAVAVDGRSSSVFKQYNLSRGCIHWSSTRIRLRIL